MSKNFLLFFLMFFSFLLTNCSKDEELLVPERTFYDFPLNKLWAHQINTAIEAKEAFTQFDGIETDIIFMGELDEFQTGHDIPSGNSLESFFDSIENCNQHYYWLDFKNLSTENVASSLVEIKQLINKFHLEKRIIIESAEPDLLSKFKDDNIFTSLWVEDINSVISIFEEHQLADNTLELIDKYAFDALSSNYKMNDFLQKYFSNWNIHLWTNGLSGESDKELIHYLALNSNVKIILVDYDENFMR